MLKVCGMREPENIRDVATLGVDLMGFIFWDGSPRNAKGYPVVVPETVKGVGVFVDEDLYTVAAIAEQYHLSYVQLHGAESAESIAILREQLPKNVSIIKAISIREADDVKRWRSYEGLVDMFLFDTKCKCVGGSGEQFDWNVLAHYDGNLPFLLSGGIGPDDAARLKEFSHPMCVGIDVNSRFETIPGHKDVAKLREFINEKKDYEQDK